MPPEANVEPLERIITLYRGSASLYKMFNIHLKVPRHTNNWSKRKNRQNNDPLMVQILQLSDKEMDIIAMNTFKKIGDEPENFSQQPGFKKKKKKRSKRKL